MTILGMVAILETVWRIFERVAFLRMVSILRMVTNIGMLTLLNMVAVLRIFIILRDGYLILGP